MLKIGKAMSGSYTYLDSLSPALVDTVRDLRKERPEITVLEIAHLLGIPLANAARLLSA